MDTYTITISRSRINKKKKRTEVVELHYINVIVPVNGCLIIMVRKGQTHQGT